jgi:hypothetical protein
MGSGIYPFLWRNRLKSKVVQEQKLGVENGAGYPSPHYLEDQGCREFLMYHPILDQLQASRRIATNCCRAFICDLQFPLIPFDNFMLSVLPVVTHPLVYSPRSLPLEFYVHYWLLLQG